MSEVLMPIFVTFYIKKVVSGKRNIQTAQYGLDYAGTFALVYPCFKTGESINLSKSCTSKAFFRESSTSSAPRVTKSASYAEIESDNMAFPALTSTTACKKAFTSAMQWLSPCPRSIMHQRLSSRISGRTHVEARDEQHLQPVSSFHHGYPTRQLSNRRQSWARPR
jgi:hypothetical protein